MQVQRKTRVAGGATVTRWLRGAATVATALAVVGSASVAGAQVRGTIIGPGATSYPIAVSPLKGNARDGDRFADIVAKDLDLSGFFKVIDRSAYIENAQDSGVTAETIDFKDWSTIGALALVKGTVEGSGDDLTVEARLFDVAAAKQLAGKRYRAGTDDLRQIAHRFADEIMAQLTGERGPFDSRIAFASRRNGRFKEIFTMSLDGGDLRALTRDQSIALSPSWSPDASALTFTSYRAGNPSLFVMPYAGGGPRMLSSRSGLNLGGRWSPGGKAVAAALEHNGSTDIALIDPNNGELLHWVTNDRAIDVSPSWSPDGRSIVFCSDRGGGPQIYVTDADGASAKRVSFGGNYNTSPAWSPKGDKIAYSSRGGGRFQIFVIDAGGGDAKQVTTSRGSNEDPSWSPDGRYLIFASTRDGSGAIYMSDLSGAHQRRLTPSGGDDSTPAWSRWLH